MRTRGSGKGKGGQAHLQEAGEGKGKGAGKHRKGSRGSSTGRALAGALASAAPAVAVPVVAVSARSARQTRTGAALGASKPLNTYIYKALFVHSYHSFLSRFFSVHRFISCEGRGLCARRPRLPPSK